MDTLKKIATFIINLKYEDIPSEANLSVARSFVDSLGVAIAGSKEKSSSIVRSYIIEKNSIPTSGIIGGNQKVSASDAALANGVSLHALDYDDTGAFTQGHPSGPIFSAIIAIAEEKMSSGQEIIEAYAIGVEVLSRLSRSMPMMHLSGWHPTSVLGSIAAAAVSAKLLKLNEEATIFALGIAGSLSSGLVNNFGTMTKHLQVGNSSSNGILAAKLASKGFSSNHGLFETNMSFQATFWKDESELLNDQINLLGRPLAIVNPGINIKKYPSCALTHRSIEAFLNLRKDFDINSQNVDSIYCNVSPRATKVLQYNNPINLIEAKFSMPFVIAVALKFGAVELSHFNENILFDDEIQKTMTKVFMVVHNDWVDGDDVRPDLVEVKFNNAQKVSNSVSIPKGNVKNPLSMDELIRKFNELTSDIISKEVQVEIIESLVKVENLPNISNIMDLATNTNRAEVVC